MVNHQNLINIFDKGKFFIIVFWVLLSRRSRGETESEGEIDTDEAFLQEVSCYNLHTKILQLSFSLNICNAFLSFFIFL